MASFSLNPQALAEKFNSGDYHGLSLDILQTLEFFETQKFEDPNPGLLQGLEVVADVLLKILSSDRFVINNNVAVELIRRNGILANMLRLTKFKNADAALQIISSQPNNFVRTLILYSPYCTVRLSLANLFQANAYLTSLWVATVVRHRWRGTEATQRFAEEILADPALSKYTLQDSNFPLIEDTSFAYFESTYASPDKDRNIRNVINDLTKKAFHHKFKIGTNKKRILVISANMNISNSIYRCLAPMLYELKPDYHLSLFHIKPEQVDELDTKLFDEIIPLGVKDKTDNFTYEMLERILKGDYGIALFSDIGLNRPSIILSNLRLAPIQITTYGHPVTSGKNQIDYYLGGEAVEESDNPQRHFDEKLVLIPGLGVEPVRLNYQLKSPPRQHNWLEVGLSWGEMKFTYTHLRLLDQIIEKTKQQIRFHFIGIKSTSLTYLAIRKDLEEMFGNENILVSPSLPNNEYLEAVEKCDLFLDSYHFGSYNRIVDILTLRKPVITLEGEKSYNRFASALLRQVGLDELIAKTAEEFVEKSIRLVDDNNWRESIITKIKAIDLEEKLFNTGNARHFKSFIDSL